MMIKKFAQAVLACVLFCAAGAQADSGTVFELRTYIAEDGKAADLHKRFANHTTAFFEKHGMRNVGYWVPQDPERTNTIIYILAHKSRAAAKQSWEAFGKDPEWHKVVEESTRNGEIVKSIESVYMTATEYSLIK